MLDRARTGIVWTALLLAGLGIQNLNHWPDLELLLGNYFVLTLLLACQFRSKSFALIASENWALRLMGLYLCLLALDLFTSQVPFYSTVGAIMCAWLPFSFFALIAVGDSKLPWLQLNLWSLWTPIIALAVLGLHQGLGMNERANGVFPDYNSYAALLYMAAIPLASFCIAGRAPRWQWWVLVLLASAIAAANSKGAYAAIAVALLLLSVLQRSSAGAARRAALVAGIFIVTYAAVTQAPGVHRDFSDREAQIAPSIEARVWMWRSALRAYVKEAPLVGTGLYTYKLLYAQYRDPREIYSSGDQTHNDYVQWLLEGGPLLLLGLIAVGPVMSGRNLLRASRRLPADSAARAEALGLAAACAALALHASVNFIYKTPTLMLLAGVYLARTSLLLATARPPAEVGLNLPPSRWLRPLQYFLPALALIALLAMGRDAIVRLLVEPPNPLVEKYFPQSADEVLRKIAWLAPDNPYPKNLLVSRLMDKAKRETDPALRLGELKEAYSIVERWIESDRFEVGAWRRAAEISRMDPQVTGQRPDFFLGIALAYRPSNFWIRGQLAQEQKISQAPKAACDTLRQGAPWVAGTPTLLTPELEHWASSGLALCAAFSDDAELSFWRGNAEKFADTPPVP